MNGNLAASSRLLQRTAITAPFSIFIDSLHANYPDIGKILRYEPILEGYESANFILETQKRKYVVKIFESNREKGNIDSLVRILEEAPTVGVPTLKLVSGREGNLSVFLDKGTKAYYYLTEFWEGENYENRTPTHQEILDITNYLSKINTLNFPVVEAYDSWGNNNLVEEYKDNTDKVPQSVKEKVNRVVEELEKIKFSNFSRSVIHADMQRKHVLKNTEGEYCILDFGCMGNDAKVFEVSTYLAWFCLAEDTWKDRQAIMNDVVSVYMQVHKLGEQELESIPALIRAAYAAYLLKTSLLILDGDCSEETRKWNERSERMLELSKNLI